MVADITQRFHSECVAGIGGKNGQKTQPMLCAIMLNRKKHQEFYIILKRVENCWVIKRQAGGWIHQWPLPTS